MGCHSIICSLYIFFIQCLIWLVSWLWIRYMTLLRLQPFQNRWNGSVGPHMSSPARNRPEPTAPDSDINQTASSSGRPSMWKNRCMHAAVCLLRAGQPKRAGDVEKSGEFLGEFSWVEFDPVGVRGLSQTNDNAGENAYEKMKPFFHNLLIYMYRTERFIPK